MSTPIVHLLPMSEADFPAYRDYFIEDYARDLASNHGLSLAEARQQAGDSLQKYLPQGAATPGESLLCIIPVGDNIENAIAGYLWHRIDSATRTTFIYDFYLLPAHRGRGLGKSAMAALEAELIPLGITQVAYDNPRARALYEELGFRITGYNMAKHLP